MTNLMKTSILIILGMMLFFTCSPHRTITINYLVLENQLSPEDQAIMRFAQNSPQLKLNVTKFEGNPEGLISADVLWIHIPDSLSYDAWLQEKSKFKILRDYYQRGGRLLLTNYASLLPYEFQIEPVKPELLILEVKDDWLFDKKGLQSYRGHPVFHSLFGAAFIWDAYEDHHLPIIGYFNEQFPEKGKVIAVGKSYITIHANHKLMIEFDENEGKIISVGGMIYFSRANHHERDLHTFISNTLQYLAGDLDKEPVSYWQKFDHRPAEFSLQTRPLRKPICREIELSDLPDMVLQRTDPQNNYFDVSGRRVLVMGKENAGIEELWVHPFRVLRDYEVGVIRGDTIQWLREIPLQVQLRPESFLRSYDLPEGRLEEIILPALHQGGMLAHYRGQFPTPIKLVIKFRSDLRWMWPYDEYAIGDMEFAYDPQLNALHLRDSAGNFYSVAGGDLSPIAHLTGQFEEIQYTKAGLKGVSTELNQVFHAAVFELTSANNHILNFGITGTSTGKPEALREYHSLLFHPQNIYRLAWRHYRELLDRTLGIQSPDPEFNQLWKWAIVATDKFMAYTPGVGTGLLAGFSTTARGWRGGHKISGRPGYAWYFGRDSEWCGFAIDDYGDFALVREQLEFLQKFQDERGKIFHEISTSGVVHFDAADATPLYIILAAHYLRASGDLQFIRHSWPYIERAMGFLYSTDTDGDLLIENTNEGHGWVEGGKLFGAHTTFYLAALWAQTLKDAAYISSGLGLNDISEKYRGESRVIQNILNTQFWNDSTRFYNYGKMKDGSYNTERTVLPAVAMYYQLLDDAKVDIMLDEYASNNFSPDWGVRIVSSESPLFVPYGYHYGSVWPLFTGWTALAEFSYGNSLQGFTHLMNNMLIKNHWAMGYVEEVMNGAVYKPSGVCPHQAWSETNILHPGIHGMIGWKPDAMSRSAVLTPRLPLNWDSAKFTNLKIGESVIDWEFRRSVNSTCYHFSLLKGPAIRLAFAPEIPLGMTVNSVSIDGVMQPISSETNRGILTDTLRFYLTGTHEIVFNHQKGVGMIPFIPRPLPDDTSRGYKIIRQSLEGDLLRVTVEGQKQSSADFMINIFDQQIENLEGATIISQNENGRVTFRVDFPSDIHDYPRKVILIKLR